MDYKRLAVLTNKLLLKVNTDAEYQEYQKLHEELHLQLKTERFTPTQQDFTHKQ